MRASLPSGRSAVQPSARDVANRCRGSNSPARRCRAARARSARVVPNAARKGRRRRHETQEKSASAEAALRATDGGAQRGSAEGSGEPTRSGPERAQVTAPPMAFERSSASSGSGDRARASASHDRPPGSHALVEPVCCWCQPARVARFDATMAPRVRFGICSDCLESRLREIRGLPRPRSRS